MKTSKIEEPTDTYRIVYNHDATILRLASALPEADIGLSCERFANDLAITIGAASSHATVVVTIDEKEVGGVESVTIWGGGCADQKAPSWGASSATDVKNAAAELIKAGEWIRVAPELARKTFAASLFALGMPELGKLDLGPYVEAFPHLGEDGRATFHAAWLASERGRRAECLVDLSSIPPRLSMTPMEIVRRIATLETIDPAGEQISPLLARLSGGQVALASSIADQAVSYLLNRRQTDADLGHLISPLTQSFERLCAAEAQRTGENLGAVMARRATSHHRYPRSLFKRGDGPPATDASEIELHGLSAQGLDELRGRITSELEERYARPLRVGGIQENGNVYDVEIPPGGVLLHAELGTGEASYVDWYPTMRAAQAGLHLLADEHGRKVLNDGFSVDLTRHGFSTTKAWLEERV